MINIEDALAGITRVLNLDSSIGIQIDNYQISELSQFELNQAPALYEGYPNVVRRSGNSARYNCHGLSFGSRRTNISDSLVLGVLTEDGYVEISGKSVMEGDLVVYFETDGAVTHSAIVVLPDAALGIPKVVSKWGKFGEMVHFANDCPYNFSTAKFFRIKP